MRHSDERDDLVFLNGQFYRENEAMISIHDRGFLFGEGVFTTLRLHRGKVELLLPHLERLKQHASFLQVESPSIEWPMIEELIQRQEANQGTWRLKIILTIKREKEERRVGNLLITLHPHLEEPSLPCRLCLFPYPLERPLARLKSLSYLDSLAVHDHAKGQGYDDAITTTSRGYLLETSRSNLFWIHRGECWVPDPELPYLKGVFLQALTRALPLPLREGRITIEELPLPTPLFTSVTH